MKKIIFCFMSMLILVGCDDMNKSETKANENSLGMANPASVYCEKIGGKLTIKETAEGQYGICNLPNGEQVDEWELYRRDHK